MGETDWGGNWVLFWWAGPCSVNLLSNFLLKGRAGFPPCYLTWGQTNGGNEDNGKLLQKVPCLHYYTQCPQPCSRPLLIHASLEEKLWPRPRQLIKKQRHYFDNKGPSSQIYGFSSSHIWMWELDCKKRWVPKNCCFWTMVLEKTLESPLECKEIQPVHLKGNQSWIFIGRTDVESETPILWPPDAKSIWKDPDAGKDRRWKKKGTTKDEMVGWHHRLNGHEFEETSGVGDGQGGLAHCKE